MLLNRWKWLVLAIAVGLGACAQVKPVTEVAKANWVEARTDNFIVVTNGSDARARRLIENLEEFRRFAITALEIEVSAAALPFTIYAVSNDSELQSLVETAGVFGVFQNSYRGGLAVVNVNARGPDGTDRVQRNETLRGPQYRVTGNTRVIGTEGVFHEYVHYLQALDPNQSYPLWFSEGYAEYLSTFRITPDGHYRVGEAPMHRVEELRAGVPDPRTRRTGDPRFRWIPFDALLNARGYDTGHGSGPLYGQAWLLTHYLLSDPARAEKLKAYLEASNVPTVDSVPVFEEVFGLTVSQLGSRLRQYMRAGRFSTQRFDRPDEQLPEPVLSQVAPDDIRTRLGYVVLHFSPSLDKAETLLNEALAINPGNIPAQAWLASLAFARNDDAEVDRLIKAAGPAARTNVEYLILQGHVDVRRAVELFRAEDDTWREAVTRARRFFEAAIERDPNSVEPKLALARTYFLSDYPPPDSALQVITRAHDQSPANIQVRLALGHLLFRRGAVGTAQEHFEHVIVWSRNPEARRRAREMVEYIQAILAQTRPSEQSMDSAP